MKQAAGQSWRGKDKAMSQTSISSIIYPEPSNTQVKSSLTSSHQYILSARRSASLVKTKLRKSYNLHKRLVDQLKRE